MRIDSTSVGLIYLPQPCRGAGSISDML